MKLVLAFCLLGFVAAKPYLQASPADDLQETLSKIKKTLTTDDGIVFLRDYMKNLQTTHPSMILAKTLLTALSNQALKDILNEVLKELPDQKTDPSENLSTLFRNVKTQTDNDEGLRFIRDYVGKLKSGNFLIVRMKAALKNVSDEKFRELLNEVFGGLGLYLASPASDLEAILSKIKKTLTTDAGTAFLRDYMKNLQTTHPSLILAKTLLTALSSQALKDILNEVLKEIPNVASDPSEELLELFRSIKTQTDSDEGLQYIRNYVDNLKSGNFLIVRMKAALKTVSNENMRELINEVFGGLGFYLASPASELETILSKIKKTLTTEAGIAFLRDYMKNLQTTHPSMILAKTLLSALGNQALKDILNEVLKDLPNVDAEPSEDLLELFRSVKPQTDNDEGLKYIRDYVDKLQSGNFLIVRMKAALKTVSNEKFRELINEVFGGLGLYLSSPYDNSELRSTLAFIKNMITTKYGIKFLRDHLESVKSTEPELIFLKSLLPLVSDQLIIDMCNEVFKNIPDIQIEEGFEYPGLDKLFEKAKALVLTDEGVQFIRTYLETLETENFVINQIKSNIKTTSDAQFRQVIEILGTTLGYYMSAPYDMDLKATFTLIKHHVQSNKGFQTLVKYLTELNPKTPTVSTGQKLFLSMNDFDRRIILDEFLKNFPVLQVEQGFEAPSLSVLLEKVRTLILSNDGLQALRDYATNLQTTHKTVLGLKALLETVDDDTLRVILQDLLQ